MADIVAAYIVTAYIVMACNSHELKKDIGVFFTLDLPVTRCSHNWRVLALLAVVRAL